MTPINSCLDKVLCRLPDVLHRMTGHCRQDCTLGKALQLNSALNLPIRPDATCSIVLMRYNCTGSSGTHYFRHSTQNVYSQINTKGAGTATSCISCIGRLVTNNQNSLPVQAAVNFQHSSKSSHDSVHCQHCIERNITN